ncbi:sterol desaturase [Vibrio sp. UCD-FRSSP16_10]|uniref:sterol desaturase family protein n=1 Tax=unclassified Vibrio TaxID=2614977 RepID=UPI0007FFE595|nr:MULTISPECIES: sterol desaturase family protein [unclassified Vibrio]OBT12167.1 sterol desaturase [Vibrio sp. UCD-FRSSP16_30]OBT20498.1 sterol desaturase [Vibrio sp. UCD-FRSSP16_10]
MDIASLRMSIFVTVLLTCALAEYFKPRRKLSQSKPVRWANNLGLTGLNSLLIYLTMPLLAIEAAMWAHQQQIGLFNQLAIAPLIAIIACVLILDCVIYWQHRLFHSMPLLWRLHKVHHADQDIDVTTGARFHPIEIGLSMVIKIAVTVSLGIPVIAIIVFEIMLNASAMFNHSNIRLPSKIDALIRRIIVTPDMHRVHHSTIRSETDSNYGFFLSTWDHLFNSYQAQPKLGHKSMHIGISQFRRPQEQRIDKMLTQPFRNQ